MGEDVKGCGDVPSTTETIPLRLLGVVVLNVGELDIGDSSVTNTRCAFAAGRNTVSVPALLRAGTDVLASSFCMV